MSIDSRRVALLVEDEFNLDEFIYPFHRFREAGAELKVVGSSRAPSFASQGMVVFPDLTGPDAAVEDFDAVIIPGGYAPDWMRRDRNLVAFVRGMHEAGKPVAAICHGGSMLVSAKILAGRQATSNAAIRDDLEAAGAIWLDEEVVVDGNLITSRRPWDLPALCRAVLAALGDADAASSPASLSA
jgi:protease I